MDATRAGEAAGDSAGPAPRAADIKLMLVDGYALVYRAYHALPELTTSSGELINAVFGWTSMVLKALDMLVPTHAMVAFDCGRTFRHDRYAPYKATRAKTPPPLLPQFERVREVAQALNMPILEAPGYEADDVLGTLARRAEAEGISTVIVTGDLDTLQLVTDSVSVLTNGRQFSDTKIYTPTTVRERYGLEPSQIPDLKGLVGDTSDNIPGVKGIGEKTAAKLLSRYGSLDGLYKHIDEITGRTGQLLREGHDVALESRHLATIVTDAPVPLALERALVGAHDSEHLLELLRALEFRSLIGRVRQTLGGGEISGEETAMGPANTRGHPGQLTLFGDNTTTAGRLPGTDGPTACERAAASGVVTQIIADDGALQAFISQIMATPRWAFDSETTSTNALEAELVGLSFSLSPGSAFYIPVGHSVNGAVGNQLPLSRVLEELRPVLESEDLQKIGHNLKYDILVLENYGIRVAGVHFDTMIAAYLDNPTGRGLSLSALASSELGVEMTPIEELIGKGKHQITMDRVDIATVAAYAGMDAEASLRLSTILERRLRDHQLMSLFEQVEMPLVRVLADMERAGIALDANFLTDISAEMTATLQEIEGRIYERANHRFNINSTQQLGQVLFTELKLPSRRRTKTGFSTDSEVLESLRGQHPVVDDVLEYRQLIKLKNTYVDALPQLRSPHDGRVHTDFNQAVAATGRLSSSNPNLQNIPIRTEVGRKIRHAFVADEADTVLLAADYSQIELRVLAHMSRDPRLVEAFRTGQDVHTVTAAAVWNIEPSAVSRDQRRIAKVVNFGIIYGIGEQRLAYETGISREEAASFIASYNETYAGVKAFMDDMRKQAMLYGQVSTLLNRVRRVPEIHSDHPGVRQAAERAAINMPVQGTAADIIKVAMVRIAAEMRRRGLASRMILQVHDELVFEVRRAELAEVATLTRECMESAIELAVPLEVELKAGTNWGEMLPL